MTLLAHITDVHADVHALRDALAQINRLGCDLIVCGGDLVDWGMFPEETLAVLRERRIPCIRGNHDRWATKDGHDMSGWDLTPRSIAFLESLPTSWSKTIDGVRVVVWHARPGSDMNGIYPTEPSDNELRSLLDKADADVLLVGHTHVAFVRHFGTRIVANPGALLRDPAQPMEQAMIFDRELGKFVAGPAPGGGTFGILELPSRKFTVHRAADGAVVAIDGDGRRG